MNIGFIAEPIVDLKGRTLGVELLTRFISNQNKQLHPGYVISGWDLERKRGFLFEQCSVIANKQDWFLTNHFFCTVNIDHSMATLLKDDSSLRGTFESMPFIKLEISEQFPGLQNGQESSLLNFLKKGKNALWLDDLGAGGANVKSLINGYFDVVKIDRVFFNAQVKKASFPLLIKKIRSYCDRIVVEGIESDEHLEIIKSVGILGLQGYLFESVPFQNIEILSHRVR